MDQQHRIGEKASDLVSGFLLFLIHYERSETNDFDVEFGKNETRRFIVSYFQRLEGATL